MKSIAWKRTTCLHSLLLAATMTLPSMSFAGPLHDAAKSGDAAMIEQLLDHGADVDVAAEFDRTALHLAALKGHPEVISALLAAGAEVDPLDGEGVTPLGLAMASCGLETAKTLIEHGANVNIRFHAGATMLHALPYAENYDRHREMAEMLVAAGADVNAVTERERNTPLHTAAMFGDYDTAEILLQAGAYAEHANTFGDRPLHGAAALGQARIVTMLLQHGARVGLVDQSGLTALHMAAARGEIRKGRNLQDFVKWRRNGQPLPTDYITTVRTRP